MRRQTARSSALVVALTLLVAPSGAAQKPPPAQTIPHGQSQPPGPALAPAEAIARMKVPDGFSVELVAAEPDLVNPVAMTFDERGRIWVTESLEYPRKSAGPGRDRVKVLESTRGDGKYDKITVFADGLNIPSGIAVGHGGVWVANAPDILFYKEGPDGKAAGKPEVVVTGFGRDDTHELPNSLTWGPDGWLYGWNGVFNRSVVKQNGKTFAFTCGIFRIHPKTRAFELFCEGTSNPWGIAYDPEGSAFATACVIDHLWHLTETGYYHRQAGAYPPFTWKIESIVRHRHQKAAYCGVHYFDSDAYPPEYRDKLYMGNIHGNCVNADALTRDGATYLAKPRPDFLTANDAWFMPVAQKTGPDGCLYILDWYDRYHCYQDANRDPKGIDRERGRLYRVRYKDTPRAGLFDLGKEDDDQLIKRLHSPNVYFRDLAQRLLCERNAPETRAKLQKLILDDSAPRKARMHALWALVGTGTLAADFHHQLLGHKDPGYRAWGVRAAGNAHRVGADIREKVAGLARDPAPDVRVQVAVAARKIEGLDPMPLLTQVLATSGDDKLIPHIVWQNLHPLLEDRGAEFIQALTKLDLKASPAFAQIVPRAVERMLAARKPDFEAIGALLPLLTAGKSADAATAARVLTVLAKKVQTGEIAGPARRALADRLGPTLRELLTAKPGGAARLEAAFLAASLKDPAGLAIARQVLTDAKQGGGNPIQALDALVAGGDASLPDTVAAIFASPKTYPASFRGEVLAALGKLDDPNVADALLAHYAEMEGELKPRAIELLTQRTAWAKPLLRQVAAKKIPASALNVNQVRRLLSSKDAALAKQVKAVWGTVRDERNPAREKVVKEMRDFLRKTPGDPKAGAVVFKNVCAQCHKIHGEGQDVGPDITSNGRNDFDQLVSNVFDPSLVIGAGYAATTVVTASGQNITGLVVEDSPQRVVLKLQGGKLETIPRGDVEEVRTSKVSLMPENLEVQLKPREIADLFAFLSFDKRPDDPTAKRIPGSPSFKK